MQDSTDQPKELNGKPAQDLFAILGRAGVPLQAASPADQNEGQQWYDATSINVMSSKIDGTVEYMASLARDKPAKLQSIATQDSRRFFEIISNLGFKPISSQRRGFIRFDVYRIKCSVNGLNANLSQCVLAQFATAAESQAKILKGQDAALLTEILGNARATKHQAQDDLDTIVSYYDVGEVQIRQAKYNTQESYVGFLAAFATKE